MSSVRATSCFRHVAHICGATTLLILSALVWRLGYAHTDWALLALVPLFLFLFLPAYSLHLATWQSRLHVMLKAESSWAPWLRGRIRAGWRAGSFATIAVVIIAWQALVLATAQFPLYLLVILVAAAGHVWFLSYTKRQLRMPYAQWMAMTLATWVAALPFLVIATYLNWSQLRYPEWLLKASFAETLQHSLQTLPRKDGWIAEVFAYIQAWDAAKLWLVLRFPDQIWLALLFCLEAALLGFVLARAGILLMQFLDARHFSVPTEQSEIREADRNLGNSLS